MADGEGIRRGNSWRFRVTVLDGGRELDLTSRTVTATGKLDSSTLPFQIPCAIFNSESGQVDLLGTAAMIADVNATLLSVEFTVTGSPTVNSNSKPLIIPLRAAYAEAAR